MLEGCFCPNFNQNNAMELREALFQFCGKNSANDPVMSDVGSILSNLGQLKIT